MMMRMPESSSTHHGSRASSSSSSPTESCETLLATRYAEELQLLIAERDTLRQRYIKTPQFICKTMDVLDKRIGELRFQIMSAVFDEPQLGSLPQRNPSDSVITLTRKKYFPTTEFPEFNFSGRILGPEGSTIKNLERKIPNGRLALRGRGSVARDNAKQRHKDASEGLHLRITVIDTEERAHLIMQYALQLVEPFFHPVDRDDLLRDLQMREIAVIKNMRNMVDMGETSLVSSGQVGSLSPQFRSNGFFAAQEFGLPMIARFGNWGNPYPSSPVPYFISGPFTSYLGSGGFGYCDTGVPVVNWVL